jgi:pimeloyl-ACP methyl ester carboxylesterase
MLEKLRKPVSFTAARPPSAGGAAGIGTGGAAGIGEFFSGIWSGVRNLLNYTTYYQMKERAGLVGANGVNPILRTIRADNAGLKVHLIGHSFGGRLVTATVAGSKDAALLPVATLSLLQAAFSHYGFAEKWDSSHDGFFRRVVTRKAVAGPAIITCTANDKAVGLAYPIASLLAGQVAAGIGDKDDKYGGIGRNGAQKTPESTDMSLLDVGGAYQLTKGRLHNLSADRFIKDHSDVDNKQVVYAVASAIATT